MRSLHGDSQPTVVTGVPPELAKEQDPVRMVESTMLSAQLFQDSMLGATYINMVTCSMSLVDLGVTPSVVVCSMPALLGKEDMDSD